MARVNVSLTHHNESDLSLIDSILTRFGQRRSKQLILQRVIVDRPIGRVFRHEP